VRGPVEEECFSRIGYRGISKNVDEMDDVVQLQLLLLAFPLTDD
jgi:hypothetical protein